jgi:hypothetical protein
MVITDEMKRAIELIETTNDSIYITGKAGTGKTTFLKWLVDNCKKNFVVTASTGIAAINAGGVTLHSLFNIPFGIHDPNSKIKNGIYQKKIELMDAIDVLVIDEVSMVRPDMIDYIDQKLRIYRKSNEPFGGVQLIMFGDLYQLPPVVIKSEKEILLEFYPGSYFFYANVFRDSGFHIVELNHIFRQTSERFIEILNNVRSYKITNDDIEDLASIRNKTLSEKFDGSHIHICSHKTDVQRINAKMLGEPTHSYNANVNGEFKIEAAPCDQTLQLRKGARVMVLTNDKHQRYCNGSLGIVEELNDQFVTVNLDNGYTVSLERHEWTTQEYKIQNGEIVSEIKGTCSQFPLTLAWAITIHKSQGLTFDNIAIHTKGVFCSGQIYVALSRCTSLEGIVSDVFIDKRHILPDKELLAFEKACKATNNFFNNKTYELIYESN